MTYQQIKKGKDIMASLRVQRLGGFLRQIFAPNLGSPRARVVPSVCCAKRCKPKQQWWRTNPPDADRFDQYELLRREDGAFEQLGRAPWG